MRRDGDVEKNRKSNDNIMCGVKLIEKRFGQEFMSLLGLKEALNRLAKTNEARWYGHVLRRDNDDVLIKALNFDLAGRRGRGRSKMI